MVLRKDDPMTLYSRSRAPALVSLIATLLNPPPAVAGHDGGFKRSSILNRVQQRKPASYRATRALLASDPLDRLEL